MSIVAAVLGGVFLLALGGLLIARNLVYLAVHLFVVLLATAGLFALAGADFLAVAHVMVYVGGILVLLLFGVLVSRGRLPGPPRTEVRQPLAAMLVGGLVVTGLWAVFSGELPQPVGIPPVQGSTLKPLGEALIGRYLLVFELLSMLLLLALIGAAYVARRAAVTPRNTLHDAKR